MAEGRNEVDSEGSTVQAEQDDGEGEETSEERRRRKAMKRVRREPFAAPGKVR